MSKGFTLIELIIVVVILGIVALLIISGVYSCTNNDPNAAFMFVPKEELKLVTDPTTGVTSECYRKFTGEWNCRPINSNLPTKNIPTENP